MEEPFNEGAAQVRRLVQRDRKEMLGNATDILDKYTTEFGDGADAAAAAAPAPAPPSSSASPAAAAAVAAPPASSSDPFAPASSTSSDPFAPSSSSSSPFGAAVSPFGGAGAASPFGGAPSRPSRLASIEPKGLAPDMSPDPIVAPPKDTRSWLARITLTQIVSNAAADTPPFALSSACVAMPVPGHPLSLTHHQPATSSPRHRCCSAASAPLSAS